MRGDKLCVPDKQLSTLFDKLNSLAEKPTISPEEPGVWIGRI
jgi:hypothetical protein